MTRDEVLQFVEAAKETNTMFSLTVAMGKNSEYWCYTGGDPAYILCSSVANVVFQFLDSGASIEDIKGIFDAILEEAGERHIERTKYLQ